MSSLRSQDRASLCSFTFADGRRCRAPRQSGDLQFCSFHARKQAQAQAAEDIGRDAGYFFSGRYLSACDLNAALGRVFAATAQGHVKPKTASALAYLAQVMVQCIHITEREYAEAFGGDGWRKTISSSVNSNSDYLNPPQPEHQPPTSASQPNVHPEAGRAAAPPVPAPPPPPSPCTAGFTPASSSLHSSTPVSSSPAPHAPVGAGFSPSPAPQSAATAPSSARGSASAIHSSTAVQRSSQQAPQPSPHVAATPSPTRQKPAPASAPQTGPSGAPLIASLPPRNPEPPPGSIGGIRKSSSSMPRSRGF